MNAELSVRVVCWTLPFVITGGVTASRADITHPESRPAGRVGDAVSQTPLEAFASLQKAIEDGESAAIRSSLHVVTPWEAVGADAVARLMAAEIRYRRLYRERFSSEPHELPMNLSAKSVPANATAEIAGNSATISTGGSRTISMIRNQTKWQVCFEYLLRELPSIPIEDLGALFDEYAANVEALADGLGAGSVPDAKTSEQKLSAIRKQFLNSTRALKAGKVDPWDQYVQRFCLLFGLDSAQRSSALSVLREVQSRRNQHVRRSEPLNALWAELAGRLDRIPTQAQRQAASRVFPPGTAPSTRPPSAYVAELWPMLAQEISKSMRIAGSAATGPH